MDLRSLSQNKAPFGSDQLSKFYYFTLKSMLMIQALLSRTKGTITMRRLIGTCLSQEPPLKLDREWRSTVVSCSLHQGIYAPPMSIFGDHRKLLGTLWSPKSGVCLPLSHQRQRSRKGHAPSMRERERGRDTGERGKRSRERLGWARL